MGLLQGSGSHLRRSRIPRLGDDFIRHTPKLGPVSRCNRTFFTFIKYLDNWEVPVNGYLFQL